MKKSLSLFVLVLVFFFASTKDSDAQFKLGLGPLTGMNFNILTGSDLNDTYTGFGFVFWFPVRYEPYSRSGNTGTGPVL